jgi:CubicO group peptidase (beta-lactamase class C family)
LPDELQARAAPTEQRDGQWIRGDVHDPRAWKLGGVAGHAGLFSTADDLARFAHMLASRGSYRDVQIMKPETFDLMIAPHKTSGGIRGLGWDKRSGFSSNRGEGFSDESIGHGGFTGTTFWVDAKVELFVIFLSNRLHPDGGGSVNQLAGKIGTIAAGAISE